MAVIYLKHPIHGHKVATLEMEAKFDERNGWERYTLSQDADVEPAPGINMMPTRTRRRREISDVHHRG